MRMFHIPEWPYYLCGPPLMMKKVIEIDGCQ